MLNGTPYIAHVESKNYLCFSNSITDNQYNEEILKHALKEEKARLEEEDKTISDIEDHILHYHKKHGSSPFKNSILLKRTQKITNTANEDLFNKFSQKVQKIINDEYYWTNTQCIDIRIKNSNYSIRFNHNGPNQTTVKYLYNTKN